MIVVMRMAETGLTRMPVVDRNTGRLEGIVALGDLLGARIRNLQEERDRERVLELRFPFSSSRSARKTSANQET